MTNLNVREWLEGHSIASQRVGNELRFKHHTGDNSLLVLREERSVDVPQPKSQLLKNFYAEYDGASIGEGDIVIGSLALEGVHVSHGFRVSSLDEISIQAERFGMPLLPVREVFAVASAWMFLYAIEQSPLNEILVSYDRDFGEFETFLGFEQALDDWWKMAQVIFNERRS